MAAIASGQLGIGLGCEWVIEALECDSSKLRDVLHLREMFDDLIRQLDLHPVAAPQWHQFPGHGGVTGLCLLSESHLACHTFPEYGSLCLNVFCCRQRDGMDFEEYLREKLRARTVTVRRLDRQYWNR
ncbi:MAG: adenosylmethionine decarboxylase [Acidobacteria bacterium]|nr:adenosylmethionine decarboxylase [Acidobacteriota bacterium]